MINSDIVAVVEVVLYDFYLYLLLLIMYRSYPLCTWHGHYCVLAIPMYAMYILLPDSSVLCIIMNDTHTNSVHFISALNFFLFSTCRLL